MVLQGVTRIISTLSRSTGATVLNRIFGGTLRQPAAIFGGVARAKPILPAITRNLPRIGTGTKVLVGAGIAGTTITTALLTTTPGGGKLLDTAQTISGNFSNVGQKYNRIFR